MSTLGMEGVSKFVPLINWPQAAILGIGATKKKYIPDEKGNLKYILSAWRVSLIYHLLIFLRAITVMNATLSCDHRVVDGAVAARWLVAFKTYLEKPARMLL